MTSAAQHASCPACHLVTSAVIKSKRYIDHHFREFYVAATKVSPNDFPLVQCQSTENSVVPLKAGR